MREHLRTWVKRAVVTFAIFVPAGVAFVFLGFEVSSQPQFCGTCHYMTPYYTSWTTSSHNEVACVECHIPPGIASELQKKYEAVAMVARYFTGTYSTNPWAEVDDESCLRSGCHEKRLLLGREVYRQVLFGHRPHLTELRRQKRLRCTSCHSQIVQGSHISVTPSTCFLCHFKDTPLNEGTGRCTLCHEIPEKRITTAGLSFEHGDVKRFDMDCTFCHEGVIKGNGEVLQERCYACHNEPARLDRYAETEFLHQVHVTDHKVECSSCHIEIVHKIPAREEALATRCERCHSSAAGHSAVRDLYRGIGGKGVKPQPAAMYLAGIHCEACHSVPQGEHRRANEVSCMVCHGPRYLTIYRTWKMGLDKREQGMGALLEAAKQKLDGRNGEVSQQVRKLIAEAEANFSLVRSGRAIHNPAYARRLLEKAYSDTRSALETYGEKEPAPRPWIEAPYASECLKCHFGVEYLSQPAFGREFAHLPHVNSRLRCQTCHGDMKKHGTLRITEVNCSLCHERITKAMKGIPADECFTCHTAEIGQISEKVNFPHNKHIASGLDCGFCHAGLADKPHREFARSSEPLLSKGHQFCGVCHASDAPSADGVPPEGANCGKCHVAF
jgi:nitrate/TMAO reductase-like tetraheme cytochrome c subunit